VNGERTNVALLRCRRSFIRSFVAVRAFVRSFVIVRSFLAFGVVDHAFPFAVHDDSVGVGWGRRASRVAGAMGNGDGDDDGLL